MRYRCEECDYQGTTKSHLVVHIRHKHRGISYRCDLCQFAASTSNNLKQHVMRKHPELRGEASGVGSGEERF